MHMSLNLLDEFAILQLYQVHSKYTKLKLQQCNSTCNTS